MNDKPESIRAILQLLEDHLSQPVLRFRGILEESSIAGKGGAETSLLGEQAEGMAQVCDEMVDMTRCFFAYGRLLFEARPEPKAVSLKRLLAFLDKGYSRQARERGLVWGCKVEGKDASPLTDEELIRQAIKCVIDNAIHYTPKDGRVEVRAGHQGRKWWVSVQDTGPGIPPESRAKVLEPLRQTGTSRDCQGHGLGLSVAKAVADRLGGSVILEAGEGGGTIVRLEFEAVAPANANLRPA